MKTCSSLHERTRRFVEKWYQYQEKDETNRPSADRQFQGLVLLYQVLKTHVQQFPFTWIHPTWILPHIARHPYLRHWMLTELPDKHQEFISRTWTTGEGVQIFGFPSPRWFRKWFHTYMWKVLPYPVDISPGTGSSSSLDEWYRLPLPTLFLILYGVGLRIFARVSPKFAKENVVAFLYQLKKSDVQIVVSYRRKLQEEDIAPWVELLPPFGHENTLALHEKKPKEILLEWAIIELAYLAGCDHHVEPCIKRIMYRLPRVSGIQLQNWLARAQNDHERIEKLIERGLNFDQWKKSMTPLLSNVLKSAMPVSGNAGQNTKDGYHDSENH